MSVTNLIAMPNTVDSTVKKNLENINTYAVSNTEVLDAIASNNEFLNSCVSITTVDLKAVATTNLFTVPTGKKFFVSGVVIECTEATAITVEAVLNVGTNSTDFDNFISAETLTGLTSTNKFYRKNLTNGVFPIAAAAEIIKVKVTTGATGTSQSAKIYLFGQLLGA